MTDLVLTYKEFSSREAASLESICQSLVEHNRDKIQIKNMIKIVPQGVPTWFQIAWNTSQEFVQTMLIF